MQEIINMAKKKASQSSCKYKVSAIAFNKKGEVIGDAVNKHGQHNTHYRGLHAEMECLSRCKSTPKVMLICRVNPKGELLQIDPCETCKKVLEKKGIKILTVVSESCIERR
jgi:deoxycytidylate deaminase